MNRTRVPIKKGPGSLRVIKGEREALEREWFWLAVLDGDPVRKEVLIRKRSIDRALAASARAADQRSAAASRQGNSAS